MITFIIHAFMYHLNLNLNKLYMWPHIPTVFNLYLGPPLTTYSHVKSAPTIEDTTCFARKVQPMGSKCTFFGRCNTHVL